MNSNTEVPVQMVMSELNPGQPMQNENANSSSQSNAVMHPTMTMAQSPLQQVYFLEQIFFDIFICKLI